MSKPDPCEVSPDLGRLLALRRVLRGGVIRFGHDEFASRGHRVPGYVGYYLAVLLADGHARFGRPQEDTGSLPVLATGEGEILHDDLDDAYQRPLRARFRTAGEIPDEGHLLDRSGTHPVPQGAGSAHVGDVLLTRREAEPLRLSKARTAEQEIDTLSALAQLIAASLDDEAWNRLIENLTGPFPWIDFLPPDAKRAFVQEFLRTARACASAGRFDRLTIALAAWKATAEAYADPSVTVDGSDLDCAAGR